MNARINELLETKDATLTVFYPRGRFVAKLDIGNLHYIGEGQTVDQALDALARDIETLNATRSGRARQLLAVGAVSVNGRPGAYYVQSQSSDANYTVDVRAGTCNCPDHVNRGIECKHIQAARRFDSMDIYARAQHVIESHSQWYAGQTRVIWRSGERRVVVHEANGWLTLEAINGKRESVRCGHLSPERGWIFTLSKAQYEQWVAKARGEDETSRSVHTSGGRVDLMGERIVNAFCVQCNRSGLAYERDGVISCIAGHTIATVDELDSGNAILADRKRGKSVLFKQE